MSSIVGIILGMASKVPGFKMIFFLISGGLLMLAGTMMSVTLVMIGVAFAGLMVMIVGVSEVVTRII